MNMRLIIRILLMSVFAAGLVWAFINRGAIDISRIEETIQSFGIWAPVIFVAMFAAATVLFLPGTVFALAGGALFGPVWGTLFNLTGATFGAVLAFLATRLVLSDWVRQRTGPKLQKLISGVEAEGWRFVAFVRLVPLFPFNLVNYAFGLTKISLPAYGATTFVCMLPGALAYTYLGYAGKEAAMGSEGLIQKGLLALALLAVAAFLPRLIKRFRRGPEMDVLQLKDQMEDGGRLLVLDVRDASDYSGETGHIAGSLNIPLADLKSRESDLDDWREHRIAVLCHTDKKSGKAVRWLRAQGFSEVILIDGGMVDWNRRGFHVELTGKG